MVFGNFLMSPRMHDPDTRRNLTGNYLTILSYHLVTTRQTREHGAQFCLGESPEYKCFDLCYSFKTLVCAEYGSLQNLHEAAWNYQNNQAKCLVPVRMSGCHTARHCETSLFLCLVITSMPLRAMGPGKATGPSWLWNASQLLMS